MSDKKNYREVPADARYIVRIEKCYNSMSKSGKPMLNVWYRIAEGDYKNCVLFQHQLRTNELGNRIACEVEKKAEEVGVGKDGQTIEIYYRQKQVSDNTYDQFFIND